jgi:hypothetical protein
MLSSLKGYPSAVKEPTMIAELGLKNQKPRLDDK